ncbi:FtsZ family protein CetZ, type III [Natronomonas moolapensis 8.8.11]|uniref:Tubulin-like protein CetZ n=1 Tax=Natronomonas moolapensis (strain DSM 18674 / CECT 7526 / JCM 14361 / 8.8.11) TaxID=268739 RepID=M1XSC1_NATM8|nr:tubulin/FtsZ family protein [Natronomonas moolapensis]CCQ37258.1 FtsZ family protein CetZ, type III [Natronomonas moolapensis 8.8.11]
MKLALVGVGGTGARVVDAVRGIETDGDRQLCYGNLLTVDISRTLGGALDHVPQAQRVTIGDTHRGVDDGVDGDQELAVEVARADAPEIQRALDTISMRELDGVLLVAGLGGGTGSGAGAVLVERLQELYDKPVYVLGVLPGADGGNHAALNAARSLRSIVPAADSTLLFDNDRWVDTDGGTDADDSADAAEERYGRANRELALRVLTLFARGGPDPSSIGANTLDASDIVRTLSPGGVASIGYASIELDNDGGLLSWLLSILPGSRGRETSDEQTDAGKIQSLVGQALNSQLTLPCAVSSAERALVVLSGPPGKLSRRGFESARQLIEEETNTVEVLAGDDPRAGSSTVAATVLLSNVTSVPRIDSMQRDAVEHKRERVGDAVPASEESG